MKISNALIGFIIIGLGAIVIGVYFAEIATQTNQAYNNGALDQFNKITEVYELSSTINQSLENSQTSSTGFNILGDFLASGFQVLKSTFTAFSIYTDMINSAIDTIPGLATTATWFRTALSAIIFIAFTFFIVSILVNRDV